MNAQIEQDIRQATRAESKALKKLRRVHLFYLEMKAPSGRSNLAMVNFVGKITTLHDHQAHTSDTAGLHGGASALGQ